MQHTEKTPTKTDLQLEISQMQC